MIAEESEKGFTARNQVIRPIQTDKTLLKQLMTILFDNAVKYTEDDGQVTFTVRTNDRHLYISVADNGPGISDADKKKSSIDFIGWTRPEPDKKVALD
ncbi:Two component system sensor histidine kinase CiaH [Streptococcus sp. HSISS2]|nr:Two component system sensor histidine kinase CiaH [Streptococcus sp. HSISS2]